MEEYDDNTLKQYLLDSESIKEKKDLYDELSVVDDEFAVRLESAEHDLIDAYLRGELDERDRRAFEAYYLVSPRRRDKVHFARAFQSLSGLEQPAPQKAAALVDLPVQNTSRATPEQTPETLAPPVVWFQTVRQHFNTPNPKLKWAIAGALILLLAVTGSLAVQTLRLGREIDKSLSENAAHQRREAELLAQLEQQRASRSDIERELDRVRQEPTAKVPQPELTILHDDLPVQTRSLGAVANITVPPGTDYVSLSVEVESSKYSMYEAAVTSQSDNRTVWSRSRLTTRTKGDAKVVDVTIPADKLNARIYTLLLKGIPDGHDEEMQSYVFRVTKQ